MNENIKIVLTGGGTAGHVMPHIAMLPFYKKKGWDVHYVGSSGIEKTLIEKEGIPFHEIPAGKLRRYISFQNFIDIFKVVFGVIKSIYFLVKIRPKLVFSKGGFVSVPVALGAWLLRIPVYSHESDLTPGLANKIINPFARLIFYCFPDTGKFLDKHKSKFVGLPIRNELKEGDIKAGYEMCGFESNPSQKVLLFMGGSLGAQKINEVLESALPELLKKYQVIHLTGKGKGIHFKGKGYKSFEFLGSELKDIFAITDLVVSRAGANSIFEFLALNLPMVLIPLEVGSRGDQVDNSMCFESHGLAKLIREKDLEKSSLIKMIDSELEKEKLSGSQTLVPSNSEDLILESLQTDLDSK